MVEKTAGVGWHRSMAPGTGLLVLMAPKGNGPLSISWAGTHGVLAVAAAAGLGFSETAWNKCGKLLSTGGTKRKFTDSSSARGAISWHSTHARPRPHPLIA